MNQNKLAKLILLQVGLFPVWAQAGLKVRGVELESPLRLRILIREFQGEKIEISGLELEDGAGRKIPGETLTCESRRRTWTCKSADYERVLTEALTLRTKAGFLALSHGTEKDGSFRGELVLVPRPQKKLALVNKLDIESYLAGLVNSEIRSDYPKEAVKAQVIAARSYAVVMAAERRRAREFFDLYGSELDQVYQGSHREDARAYRLVLATKGKVLYHAEELLKAYYHSSSGGFSEIPDNVWENAHRDPDRQAYLARSSPVDEATGGTRWKVTISPKLGLAWEGIGLIKDFRILRRSSGKRVKKIEIVGENGSAVWSGTELRQKLGPRWLKSTLFFINRTAKGWDFEGRGFGHGVGLSQLGAREMGRQGKSYEEILNFYYPYSNIRQVDLEGLMIAKESKATKKFALQAR